MRRVIALALTVGFCGFVAQAALLHVHAYDEHEHPDHHHGVAAHSHHEAPARAGHADEDEAEGEHFEPCNPAAHVRSVTFHSPNPEPFSVPFTLGSCVALARSEPPSEIVAAAIDARGHSPPRRLYRPLRAPPRHSPA